MRFLLLLIALLSAFSVFADPYTKPFGALKDDQTFKDYEVRIYRNEQAPTNNDNDPDHQDGFGCFEILQLGKQVHFQRGLIFGVGSSVEDNYTNNRVRMGDRIIGDKEPDLVISELNGGNNSLCNYYVFQISDAFKFVAEITNTGGGEFKDLRKSGSLDLVTHDVLTFEGWHCSEVDSPQPTIIYRYQDHKYRLDLEEMKRPAPSEQELEKMGGEIKRLSAIEDIKDDLNNELQVPPLLWGRMLDLIYSGNVESASKLFDLSWPANWPGKAVFLEQFKEQLKTSRYFNDINQANFQIKTVPKN